MPKKIYDSYDVRIKKPIEKRLQCNNLNDIDRPYEGLLTYLTSNKTLQLFKDGVFEDLFKPITDYINSLETSRKANFLINVKDFGAKGDGTTDDTNAIKSALTYIYTNQAIRGRLYFPTGTYIISSTLQLGGDITLEGDGYNNTTIKLKNGSNCDMIAMPNDGIERYYACIRNMRLNGNAVGQTQNVGNCLSFYNASFNLIEGVLIENPKVHGIYQAGTIGIMPMIIKCLIRGDNVNTTGHGIYLEVGSSDMLISQNDIGWFKQGNGILLAGCEGGMVSDTNTWQCDIGFKCYNNDRTRMVNCLADLSETYGFYIMDSDLFQISNCQARESSRKTNNWYSGFYLTAESTNDTQRVIMSNCISYGSMSKYGLEIQNYCSNVQVSNCSFTGNLTDRIFVADGLTNIEIDEITWIGDKKISSINLNNTNTTLTLTRKQTASQLVNFYNSSGDTIVLFPTSYGIYIVFNSTLSNIIVRAVGTSSGGVTVPTGKSYIVFYDATNYRSINIPTGNVV